MNNLDNNEVQFFSMTEAIKRVKTEPEIPLLWSGIRVGSFGFIFGPPKSGKTILCETKW